MSYLRPAYRGLTYLNEDGEDYDNEVLSQTGAMVWFCVLSAGFALLALFNIRVTSASQAFYEWNAIRLILPAIQWVSTMDCATLAVDTTMTVPRQWAIAMYMLNATIAPGIFLSTFVLTFLAYRNRSIPFCLVHRGPGRNSTHLAGPGGHQPTDLDPNEALQPLIRPATLVAVMRLFSTFCFMLSLVVNFDVVWNDDLDLAGRTGWTTIVMDPWESSAATRHVILGLVPMALVSLCCFYFAGLLWRYGSFFAMKIYPSVMNPWFYPVVGTCCLVVGQCFGPDLFPVTSRTGIWLYQLCFLLAMYEVRHDIKQAGDLGHFLQALSHDNVTGSVAAMEVTASEKSSKFERSRSRELLNLPSMN